MAQTKKKRRRKHRGTQGGRIDTRPSRGRPRSRAEAQNRAKGRQKKKKKGSQDRTPSVPSWGSALKKGAIAAVLFVGLLALFGQKPIQSLAIGVLMLGFYVPMAFLMDRFFYQRYQRQEEKKRLEREQQRTGHAGG
jgi:hypothetical protein